MFLVILSAGFCVGKSWLAFSEEILTIYMVLLIPYAYRKTRVCPLEIMAGVSVLRWPSGFRRMYRQRAIVMMWLYFSGVGIVLFKWCLLLFFFCRWVIRVFLPRISV